MNVSQLGRRDLVWMATGCLMGVVIVAGCSGAGGASCRKMGITYDVANETVTATGNETSSTPISCSFDRDELAYRCQTQTSVWTTKWRSLPEFLARAVPVGRVTESVSTTTWPISGLDIPCVTTDTYMYDDQGRPTAVTGSGSPACTTSTTTQIHPGRAIYDTWDSLGRFTHGRSGVGDRLCEFNRTLDDATNTVVTTDLPGDGCGTWTETEHYDADGLPLDLTSTTGTQTSTLTYANRITEEICD